MKRIRRFFKKYVKILEYIIIRRAHRAVLARCEHECKAPEKPAPNNQLLLGLYILVALGLRYALFALRSAKLGLAYARPNFRSWGTLGASLFRALGFVFARRPGAQSIDILDLDINIICHKLFIVLFEFCRTEFCSIK